MTSPHPTAPAPHYDDALCAKCDTNRGFHPNDYCIEFVERPTAPAEGRTPRVEEVERIRSVLEEELASRRDARISVISESGLCVREPDGTASNIIRMTTRHAVSFVLCAASETPAPTAEDTITVTLPDDGSGMNPTCVTLVHVFDPLMGDEKCKCGRVAVRPWAAPPAAPAPTGRWVDGGHRRMNYADANERIIGSVRFHSDGTATAFAPTAIGTYLSTDAAKIAVESALRTPTRCEWTLDDEDNNAWSTSCGRLWAFTEGGPIENDVKFCVECGRPAATPPHPEATNG